VPVWHESTAKLVKEGKLVVLGVTQEQHSDRCRLLAQWKGFDWPILHDPINLLEALAVPIYVAIDEHGIVRSTKPAAKTLQADFLDKAFADDPKAAPANRIGPALQPGSKTPDFDALRTLAKNTNTAAAWRDSGDALTLWGGDSLLNEAMDAYGRAVKLDPKNALALFRLGVCHRLRYDGAARLPGDFQRAVDYWGKALDLDPNQYIWRRRIQQYGPRLDQPYSFYDWVTEAEKAIVARGERPVKLSVRPVGAEIAYPIKSFSATKGDIKPLDPDGKILRDTDKLVHAEVVMAPARVQAGKSVKVHIILRLDPKKQGHWNNEAEPLRLWIDPPSGWQASDQMLQAAAPREAVSGEERALNFELQAPAKAQGKVRFTAYALYNICDDTGGQCRFLRLDIPVELSIPPGF
jgi:tetratricopeptide (TPR) repeat protein